MNEQFERKPDSVYSKRLKAGKRRTYFFDVRTTRANDYFLTITESRKRMNDDGYDRHKIFLYKEDFNKFIKGLTEAVDFVKTELMPDFNFDSFNHDQDDWDNNQAENAQIKLVIPAELLPQTGFEMIDVEVTVAHQDIIDGTERPGFLNEMESKPAIDNKIVMLPDTITEEVDKW